MKLWIAKKTEKGNVLKDSKNLSKFVAYLFPFLRYFDFYKDRFLNRNFKKWQKR